MTYGPPGSGKSDLQRTIELILGKLVKRQDFMSTAAQRSISLETDGMVVIEDEMKPRSEQERLMWQSRTGGDNFIVTTTVKQQMYDENGNPVSPGALWSGSSGSLSPPDEVGKLRRVVSDAGCDTVDD